MRNRKGPLTAPDSKEIASEYERRSVPNFGKLADTKQRNEILRYFRENRRI